jgi:hydroxymethylglutaryl-CoA lyase/(R)-citramalyl-CoA lyase
VIVSICDVGPRDGLQNDPILLAPVERAQLCGELAACGLPAIEAASFVRDDLVPPMAGAEQVIAALPQAASTFSALVLNERGLQRALDAGVEEVHVAVAATDAFARVNARMSLEEALAMGRRVVTSARAAGARVVGTVSVAFGCPFEGRVPPGAALAAAEALAEADTLVLADTVGVAAPSAVASLVKQALELGRPVGVHLHDTRNTAIAGALAALEAGATSVETSVGGLGGCPFAPGATGNLATEDLVYVLEEEGVRTGVDLDAVIRVSRRLEERLGHPVSAALTRAGGRLI